MKLRLLTILLLATSGWAADTAADFFEAKVRPVLAKNCYSCHTTAKLGGLEVSSREALLTGGKSGAAITPGNPDASLLIQAVRQTHERIKMPPTGKLAEEEIEALTAWVRGGAVWPEHAQAEAKPAGPKITDEQRAWWAFQPVKKSEPPQVKDARWSAAPIDRFILAKLEEKGLRPVGPADKRTLIRRAYYDLTGLPPSPEEVEAFENDRSPGAFAMVVDKLLASPRYGERWGRYWLDIARYADVKVGSDAVIPNVWRYRDWVIQALNDDMPYDRFVQAQIAGDLMDKPGQYAPGLGFFANSPSFQDDRVDAMTRGFMGLTVACARCHDHKFDPIPTRDYYSLLGVFESSRNSEMPLVPDDAVAEYKRLRKLADEHKAVVAEFESEQARQLAEILAAQSARYLKAARGIENPDQAADAAVTAGLDAEILDRWVKYLAAGDKEHPVLDGWRDPSFDDAAFQTKLLDVIEEKKKIDQENLIRLGGKDDSRSVRIVEVLSLERDKYFFWRELASSDRYRGFDAGVLFMKGKKLDRFLAPLWKQRLDELRQQADRQEKLVPEQYPYVLTLRDVDDPKDVNIQIRGDRANRGEIAPRQFLAILSKGEQARFEHGSGRLELAHAIGDPENPLTSRVIANRVWMYHFGHPLVATPSNFGKLGEKPSHPEMLDYLAARLIEKGWSLKALHREIMLSNAYQLSSADSAANSNVDAANKLFWRANRRRLDVEPMRDTLLYLAGDLNQTMGGESVPLPRLDNLRRTVYGQVSRRRLDGTLSLFDFPNPVSTSEGRIQTATPLQQLFFLNSEFIQARAAALASRVETAAGDDRGRIQAAYRLVFQRAPEAEEIDLGLEYLSSGEGSWPRYAQVLLSSNELLFVD